MLYTRDVDALFQRAVSAGATVQMPLTDMFWGDRYGKVVDPFGHEWQLATHVEDVPPREMAKRAATAMSAPPPQSAAD
jgi:PhnB protein